MAATPARRFRRVMSVTRAIYIATMSGALQPCPLELFVELKRQKYHYHRTEIAVLQKAKAEALAGAADADRTEVEGIAGICNMKLNVAKLNVASTMLAFFDKELTDQIKDNTYF
jgi:hypothetical protein